MNDEDRTKCSINKCNEPRAINYLGKILCNKCWDKFCAGRLTFKIGGKSYGGKQKRR